jgi:hypothetical protein
LPTIIDRLQAEGHELVTVRDLLKATSVRTTPEQEMTLTSVDEYIARHPHRLLGPVIDKLAR